jgi:hypothetical protein
MISLTDNFIYPHGISPSASSLEFRRPNNWPHYIGYKLYVCSVTEKMPLFYEMWIDIDNPAVVKHDFRDVFHSSHTYQWTAPVCYNPPMTLYAKRR